MAVGVWLQHEKLEYGRDKLDYSREELKLFLDYVKAAIAPAPKPPVHHTGKSPSQPEPVAPTPLANPPQPTPQQPNSPQPPTSYDKLKQEVDDLGELDGLWQGGVAAAQDTLNRNHDGGPVQPTEQSEKDRINKYLESEYEKEIAVKDARTSDHWQVLKPKVVDAYNGAIGKMRESTKLPLTQNELIKLDADFKSAIAAADARGVVNSDDSKPIPSRFVPLLEYLKALLKRLGNYM